MALLIIAVLFLGGCASTGGGMGGTTSAASSGRAKRTVELGEASYYASKFNGRRMASGEIYDESQLTAAHRTLAFGTRVRVTNISNGRSVIVTIKDRGPSPRNRIIDLSERAARDLGFLREGIARVRVEVVSL